MEQGEFLHEKKWLSVWIVNVFNLLQETEALFYLTNCKTVKQHGLEHSSSVCSKLFQISENYFGEYHCAEFNTSTQNCSLILSDLVEKKYRHACQIQQLLTAKT